MASTTLHWKTDETLAVGKGATVQQFVASLGGDKLEIDVAPWGEGHLRINGREIAHVDGVKDRRQAFRAIKEIAERYVETHMLKSEKKNTSIALPAVKAKLLEGKKGLLSVSPTKVPSPGGAPRLSGHSELKLPLRTSTIRPRNLSSRSRVLWKPRFLCHSTSTRRGKWRRSSNG